MLYFFQTLMFKYHFTFKYFFFQIKFFNFNYYYFSKYHKIHQLKFSITVSQLQLLVSFPKYHKIHV
uniref:Putative ovule protein n=1 Tax=Solanum chacoense TaxID=4108 RepID=A0A0V0H3F4_SOLCH